VSVGSAYSLIHGSLKFSKVCARWLPKELTEERKHKCLAVCSRHLARYREGDNFLQQIVTGDETWIHHYEPESKWQSMQWKNPSSVASGDFNLAKRPIFCSYGLRNRVRLCVDLVTHHQKRYTCAHYTPVLREKFFAYPFV